MVHPNKQLAFYRRDVTTKIIKALAIQLGLKLGEIGGELPHLVFYFNTNTVTDGDESEACYPSGVDIIRNSVEFMKQTTEDWKIKYLDSEDVLYKLFSMSYTFTDAIMFYTDSKLVLVTDKEVIQCY